MTETAAATARDAGLLHALRRRWFEVGVSLCTAGVLAFLGLRLTAWPPHEDETLALFIGRKPLDDMLATVLNQRGGAPLHFLFAWAVAHLGGGLTGLRIVSAAFAAASIPLIALLASRLTGRRAALVATCLAAGSWMLLFHGVYGRMYSLFLVTSVLSYLAFLDAAERGGARRWALWATTILLCIATHPYGALVLATQALYVVALRTRFREAALAFGAVAVLGIPFWRTDLVLAGRFEIGVGGGGARLGSPLDVVHYLYESSGDAVSGYTAAAVAVLLLAGAGGWRLARARPRSALLAGIVVVTPAAVLMAARFGDAAAPESRHLIFVLPFFLTLVGTGVVWLTAGMGRAAVPAIVGIVVALFALEVGWGIERTPELYEGEAAERVTAREEAARWLAASQRPTDVLFGYDPLFLQAWTLGGAIARDVVPRADPRLALKALLAQEPLGRGVWVLDASDTGSPARTLEVPPRPPRPSDAFETRAFGPFLVIRTREDVRDVRTYLRRARQAQLVGKSLAIADAEVNLDTVLGASERLAAYERDRRDVAVESTASR